MCGSPTGVDPHDLTEEVRPTRSRPAPRASWTKKKCTEPVAPSSGFPTDRRRSGCRSESHQPRALRTRCIADSRGARYRRQGALERTCRKLRSFLFAQARSADQSACSSSVRKKKRPDTRVRPQEFAEPGTLSSTFPTNLPLPRSAPRGASSYRRPVLGAGRNLGEGTGPIKGSASESSRYLRAPRPLGSAPCETRPGQS